MKKKWKKKMKKRKTTNSRNINMRLRGNKEERHFFNENKKEFAVRCENKPILFDNERPQFNPIQKIPSNRDSVSLTDSRLFSKNSKIGWEKNSNRCENRLYIQNIIQWEKNIKQNGKQENNLHSYSHRTLMLFGKKQPFIFFLPLDSTSAHCLATKAKIQNL